VHAEYQENHGPAQVVDVKKARTGHGAWRIALSEFSVEDNARWGPKWSHDLVETWKLISMLI